MHTLRLFFVQGCECDSFLDVEGYGNCEKRYLYGNGCYVEIPTTCTDTEIFNGRIYSISDACSTRSTTL